MQLYFQTINQTEFHIVGFLQQQQQPTGALHGYQSTLPGDVSGGLPQQGGSYTLQTKLEMSEKIQFQLCDKTRSELRRLILSGGVVTWPFVLTA